MTELTPQERDVAHVADVLSRALSPLGEDLVSWTAQTARAVFGAAACSIALLSEDGTELVFTTASGGAAGSISGMRMPAGEGIAGWVATTGQPLAVNDLSGDTRFATHVASSTGYMPSAILASPIETDDRLLGVIEILDRDSTRAGSDDDLSLLALFARQAALALEASARARRIGGLVVEALRASAEEPDAAAAWRRAATDDSGDDTAALAVSFAELSASGPHERALAAAVLRDVAAYARRSRR